MLCVSFTNLCLSFIWIIGLGSVVDTNTDTDTWDHTDRDMSTQIKFWENDIIQCNHKCRCRVGVGHDTCRTPGHTFNQKCLCNIDYLSSDFKKLGSVSHTIGGRPCLVKFQGMQITTLSHSYALSMKGALLLLQYKIALHLMKSYSNRQLITWSTMSACLTQFPLQMGTHSGGESKK